MTVCSSCVSYHVHRFDIYRLCYDVPVFAHVLHHFRERRPFHFLPFQVRQRIALEIEQHTTLSQFLDEQLLPLVHFLSRWKKTTKFNISPKQKQISNTFSLFLRTTLWQLIFLNFFCSKLKNICLAKFVLPIKNGWGCISSWNLMLEIMGKTLFEFCWATAMYARPWWKLGLFGRPLPSEGLMLLTWTIT